MSESVQTTSEVVDRLLACCRNHGDPAALAALFDATADSLFRVAIRVTGDAVAAEDALEETYLAVIETAKTCDPAHPAWQWLIGVLRRKLADAHRRDRRVVDPLRLAPRLVSEDPSDSAGRREQFERVRRALDGLSEPYRSVALLRWEYGLEPTEIAHIRGEPPGTVRSILSRAVERVRAAPGGLAALLPWTRPRGLAAIRNAVVAKLGESESPPRPPREASS